AAGGIRHQAGDRAARLLSHRDAAAKHHEEKGPRQHRHPDHYCLLCRAVAERARIVARSNLTLDRPWQVPHSETTRILEARLNDARIGVVGFAAAAIVAFAANS